MTPPEPSKELENVHEVYEQIAHHFSNTRYKPWPRVDVYLKSQPTGSIGCDVGGGNGKYLGYPHVYMVGGDRSLELTKIAYAKTENGSDDALRCDGLALPFKRFDFAISIAVVHHFSTRDRRIEAVKAILETLVDNGTALIYAWALEQKQSKRGYHEGMDQDVMVPWKDNHDPTKVYHRFYHLYKQGELEEDVISAGGEIVESGYERDNWWCVAAPAK